MDLFDGPCQRLEIVGTQHHRRRLLDERVFHALDLFFPVGFDFRSVPGDPVTRFLRGFFRSFVHNFPPHVRRSFRNDGYHLLLRAFQRFDFPHDPDRQQDRGNSENYDNEPAVLIHDTSTFTVSRQYKTMTGIFQTIQTDI